MTSTHGIQNGTVLTAFRWGPVRVRVENGRVAECLPFEHDRRPSPNLVKLAELPYSEARIRYPMVREGYLKNGSASRKDRGGDRWVRVSWDEALSLCADEIRRVYEEYGPSAVYGSSYGWMSTGKLGATPCMQRLLSLMGGFIGRKNSYSTAAISTILPYVVGSGDPKGTAWEEVIEHAERIVFWGCDPVITNDVDWFTPLHESADYFRALKKKGTKTIAVNPLKPDTAEYFGSEWISVYPGTDAAMMAGMIHELVKTGKADQDFLKKCTSGWEQLYAYIAGKEDGIEKTPEWAAAVCGVPAEKIRSFAHELQTHRSMLMIGWGPQRARFGEQPNWMLVALASVLGQIGLPGGGFGTNYHYSSGGAPRASGPFLGQIPNRPQSVKPSEKPWKGSRILPAAAVSDCLLNPGKTVQFNGEPVTFPEVHLVVWCGGNPFAHHPDTNQLRRAFRKPDTVIVTDTVWTATARHADIVLPACTAFEHPDITNIGSYTNAGLIAMHQAVEPLWESKTDYRIYAEMAAELGIGEAYTEGLDEMGWIRRLYEETAEKGRASGFELPAFDDFWEKGSFLFEIPESERHFVAFADFRKNPEKHPLLTESGKIQLYSEKIASYGYADCPGHPVYLEPEEGAGKKEEEFPLSLVACKSRERLHSQLDCTPSQKDSAVKGREPVWLHPEDAAERGIRSGDPVLVKSRRGQVIAGALVTERVKKGVIVLRHGAWFNPVNTQAGETDVRGNSNTLVLDLPTSQLACGNIASTASAEVCCWKGPLPEVSAYRQPEAV